jgi:hypothetical protein
MLFKKEISSLGDNLISQIPSATGFSFVVVIILEMIVPHSPTRNKCSNMKEKLHVSSTTQQRTRSSQHGTAQNFSISSVVDMQNIKSGLMCDARIEFLR